MAGRRAPRPWVCPLWVKSRQLHCKRACPLCPQRADIHRAGAQCAMGLGMWPSFTMARQYIWAGGRAITWNGRVAASKKNKWPIRFVISTRRTPLTSFSALSPLSGSAALSLPQRVLAIPMRSGRAEWLRSVPNLAITSVACSIKQTLPLNDHEVVITATRPGPLPPYTDVILEILTSQCVKATHFLIGQMARTYPSLVRRIYNAGHTVGTHTLDHPLALNHRPLPFVAHEVDGGIAAVEAAIGDAKAVAPFFRIPGLARSDAVDSFLASQSLVTWSADVVADDWFKGMRRPDGATRHATARRQRPRHPAAA